MEAYKEIHKCRICGNEELLEVVDLGSHALTGIFPAERDADLTAGPLQLVKCSEGEGRTHVALFN